MEDETESLIDVRKRTMAQYQENQEIGRREPRGEALRTEKKTSKTQYVCCIREEMKEGREEKTSKTQEVVVLGREEMEEGRDRRGKRWKREEMEEMKEGREGGKRKEPFIDVLKGMMIHSQENQEARMD